MKWNKQGLLYRHQDKNQNDIYSTVPFVKHLTDDVFRVYFSPRDEQNRSYPFFIDVDIFTKEVLQKASGSLIEQGAIGTFDDAGCVLFQILEHAQKRYLYYSGWTLCKRVPFTFFIGLATGDENSEIFYRYSPAPIIGPNKNDPYLAGAPWVIIENNIWKMWYITGLGWTQEPNGVQKHFYTITYAESVDGIDWKPSGKICIPFQSEKEYAIARPMVLKQGAIYKMWYSYRETDTCATYQIGYAESADGIQWQRKDDEAGITTSDAGWDSEMICYPFVFEHKGQMYMIYNGNEYGKTGFGIAILED
jgi:hypothetical protein